MKETAARHPYETRTKRNKNKRDIKTSGTPKRSKTNIQDNVVCILFLSQGKRKEGRVCDKVIQVVRFEYDMGERLRLRLRRGVEQRKGCKGR